MDMNYIADIQAIRMHLANLREHGFFHPRSTAPIGLVFNALRLELEIEEALPAGEIVEMLAEQMRQEGREGVHGKHSA